jgi:hypothetical protein
MSVLRSIACRLNQHQPLRRDVKWGGNTYVGVCRHCDEPIERRGRRRWRNRHSQGANQNEPTPT